MNTLKSTAVAAFACWLVLAAGSAAQKKKKEITQTLQLPKDLPTTVTGETRRLTFHVTPLSAKGLLSAQVRDASAPWPATPAIIPCCASEPSSPARGMCAGYATW